MDPLFKDDDSLDLLPKTALNETLRDSPAKKFMSFIFVHVLRIDATRNPWSLVLERLLLK